MLGSMIDLEINIKFVGEVEKHEILYNYKLPGYSRKDTTEKAWQEVAAKVNLKVAECKEKWRNLRTVFMQKMKPPTSGSGEKRKAYYMAETIQFCLPFVKALAPPSSGNFPQVPRPYGETCDDNTETSVTFHDPIVQDNSSSSTSPRTLPQPPNDSRASPERIDQFRHSYNLLTSYNRGKRSLALENKSAAEADQCFAEYFTAKKQDWKQLQG